MKKERLGLEEEEEDDEEEEEDVEREREGGASLLLVLGVVFLLGMVVAAPLLIISGRVALVHSSLMDGGPPRDGAHDGKSALRTGLEIGKRRPA